MAFLSIYGSVAYYAPYGTLTLTNSSPAQMFVEPLTQDEVRQYLVIDDAVPEQADNDQIAAFITAARAQAEILQGRDLVLKSWDLNFDYWTNWRITLRAPLLSVDLLQYTDSANVVHVMDPSNYFVDNNKRPGLIMPAYNQQWPNFTPCPSSAILIRFTSGVAKTDPYWQGMGSLVKNGMKMLISHWYTKRLPFEAGISATNEYPYAVTAGLSAGCLVSVR